MNACVADTHAVIWYLIESPALSAKARLALNLPVVSRDSKIRLTILETVW